MYVSIYMSVHVGLAALYKIGFLLWDDFWNLLRNGWLGVLLVLLVFMGWHAFRLPLLSIFSEIGRWHLGWDTSRQLCFWQSPVLATHRSGQAGTVLWNWELVELRSSAGDWSKLISRYWCKPSIQCANQSVWQQQWCVSRNNSNFQA